MRSKSNIKKIVRFRKKKHINKVVSGTTERPRLVVFKSMKHIYAQLVDDVNQKTITGISSLAKEIQDEITTKKKKLEVAKLVGMNIGKKAQELKIENVVFDRNGYLYHGRVKAVAEGAREVGLKL